MDFRKFAIIAFKDIRALLMDRAALVINILIPLILTFVIGAAFSGLSSGGSPIKHIPVVVVNHDAGATLGTQQINFGQTFTDTLRQVGDLLDVTILTDEAEAKAQVIQGKAAVAIMIPADFSQTLNPTNASFGDNKINLALFRDSGSPLSADIASAVVRQILNSFTNANVAVYAASKTDSNPLFLITQSGTIAQEVGAKTGGSDAPVQVTTSQSAASEGPTASLLQYFAPAMAVFFLNFAMAFGAITLLEERDNWTLQRMLISPTRRLTILAGKLAGTYVNGLLQVTTLIIATSLLAPILGNKSAVWGNNLPALAILTVVVVAASTGFGTLLAALAKTRQQASIYTSAVLTIMGLVGGAFTPTSVSAGFLSKLTINYWATNAYATLGQTGDLATVLPNIAALLIMFIVFFGSGVILFSRRLDV
ncbi:MAG: ABC transporter permease [Chloroflexota bacterium]